MQSMPFTHALYEGPKCPSKNKQKQKSPPFHYIYLNSTAKLGAAFSQS